MIRKRVERILAVVLVIALAGVLSGGCAGNPSKSGEQKDQSTQAADGGNKQITLYVAYESSSGEPVDMACNDWNQMIEERSNGEIKVELSPASLLGTRDELMDEMLKGAPVCTIADVTAYAERGVPDFGIMFAPYLFDTWKDCWKLVESDWYTERCAKLEEKGFKVLASNWIHGERHILTTKPVHNASDLAGMRIAVPDITVFEKGFEALGASPAPMALGKVYEALQEGTIDGLENLIPLLYKGRYYEVANYLILDGHVKNFTTWCVGTKFFNSLSEKHQKILIETAVEAGKANNEYLERQTEDYLQMFEDEGVTVYKPAGEDLKSFKAAAEKFCKYPEISRKWTPGLYETVKEIIN
ncbi:MAG: C4-dicarboxylate TRAP transporter substrate-binding protein [Bacillota bacterium]